MDKLESTVDIVVTLNKFRDGTVTTTDFISKVCSFFDIMKNEELTNSDLQLLIYLANIVGIPHYFDMLSGFSMPDSNQLKEFNLNTVSSLISDSFYILEDETKIHKYQKEVYDLFKQDTRNRYFLSASTSFGKTFLVYEVIKKMQYDNILLVFPTIALLAENLEKLKEDENYKYFRENYVIHTLSDEREDFEPKNIFLFTPERYLSFLDKNGGNISFDFCFVDEVYKIDNDYIIDEEVKENDRDVAYRIGIYEIFRNNSSADVLLVGPYIVIPNRLIERNSFTQFLDEYGISSIDKNEIEIVNKFRTVIPNTRRTIVFDGLEFNFSSGNQKSKQLNVILNEIARKNENSIIYCFSKASVESYAKKLIPELENAHEYSGYANFITHVEDKFRNDWIVPFALKHGIGIHHGVVPKYIQKEIINLFNQGQLKHLFATTTITEGVNTTAKNIVALHHKKGTKDLKQFDAKNIEGRAGRFLAHYQGRVIIMDSQFQTIIQQEGEKIKHKNFDSVFPKDDIDLDITNEIYLSTEEIERRDFLIQLQIDKGIPAHILDQFKTVSKADKIHVYDKLLNFTPEQHASILELIQKINYSSPQIDYNGFQIILETFIEIVRDRNMIFLLGKKEFEDGRIDEFSRITHKLFFYLRDGFMGAVNFQIESGNNIDTSIRKASEFIYNTLKYQLVKYLGIFNAMYKYERSLHLGDDLEEVNGIDRLLIKLEYNAFNYSARIASDYGAPYNVIKYFDAEVGQSEISLDSYEISIRDKINRLLLDN